MKITARQRNLAKKYRAEKKEIEKILHPCIKFDGIDVLHEHLKNGKIRFTAWLGDNPLKNGMENKEFYCPRLYILTRPDFYKLYEEDLKWLTEK